MLAKSSSARGALGMTLRLALFTILVVIASAFGLPRANASTFVINGATPDSGTSSLTGTINVDAVGGTITSADLFVGAGEFTNIALSIASAPSNWELEVDTGTPLPSVDLIFTPSFDATHTVDLTGFTGGTIVSWSFHSEAITKCATGVSCGLGGATGTIDPTPLPAALPLFATGLGGLGLLGWRRKRKAQAVG